MIADAFLDRGLDIQFNVSETIYWHLARAGLTFSRISRISNLTVKRVPIASRSRYISLPEVAALVYIVKELRQSSCSTLT